MQLQITGDAPAQAVDVSDVAFGREFNAALVHQVVTAYMAGARVGSRAQKTRAETRGGGAKPWRQKGTGRARAGSIRSPLWRGGGKIFAARPQDYRQKVNRKMYRGAMRSILSELVRQGRLQVLERIDMTGPRTRNLVDKLSSLGLEGGLIVVADVDRNLHLAARNLRNVRVQAVDALNPASLVDVDNVIMTVAAVRRLEKWLAYE